MKVDDVDSCFEVRFWMYFPSTLPVTRLSVSTSDIPAVPSRKEKPSPLRPASRGSPRAKFNGNDLGGVQEEEAESVIAICRADDEEIDRNESGSKVWAVLGREDLSIWYFKVSSTSNSLADYSFLILGIDRLA